MTCPSSIKTQKVEHLQLINGLFRKFGANVLEDNQAIPLLEPIHFSAYNHILVYLGKSRTFSVQFRTKRVLKGVPHALSPKDPPKNSFYKA